MPYKIALIIGSLRRESMNRRLAQALLKLAPADFSFTESQIADLPLYNQDDDSNQSAEVRRLKSEIGAADGLLFVAPEYNRSIPGVLKNAIDHGSRPYGQNSWKGKPAGVIGVSPGATGTSMAQQHLRNVLAALDVSALALPEAFIQMKEGLIDENGEIGPNSRKFLQGWMDAFTAFVRAHPQ